MGRIPDHIIDQIRDQANVVEIIGEHVNLKKAGRNYLGLCPFHKEKTPSFNVNPERGMYKCFGCGKGGNVITFVQDHLHMTFPDAVRHLAGKMHIEIPEEQDDDPTGMQARREEARAALREAARLFQDVLSSSDGAPARRVLEARGFNEVIIEQFGIGASPAAWDTTMKHLLDNGFTQQHLEDAGLVIVKDDGKVYDRFRGRVMFPIRDDSGRVVGFSARILGDDKDAPKYINSPQTIVFDKSRVLYGLDLAKRSIMKDRRVYLVEGQADVIAMHQAGFTATVASSGTALTPEQLRSVKRYADTAVLVFDADAAGQKAMTRGIELALAAGLDVQCVVLPEGEDPDSVIQGQGAHAMQDLLEAATPWMEYQTGRYRSSGDLDDPVRQADAVRTLLTWITGVPDALRHPFLLRDLADRFELEESTLKAEFDKVKRMQRPAPYQHDRQQPAPQQRPPAPANSQQPQQQPQPQQGSQQVPPLLPPERELLRTALTVEHGLALIQHQYHIDASTFYTERGQQLFRRIQIAEHETHDIVEHLLESEDLDSHDKELIRALVGSAVRLSAKWKDFDIEVPDLETARTVRDALLGIALQRTVAEIEVIMRAVAETDDEDQHQRLANRLQQLMNRREELRQRYQDDPTDLRWLDADTTSAS